MPSATIPLANFTLDLALLQHCAAIETESRSRMRSSLVFRATADQDQITNKDPANSRLAGAIMDELIEQPAAKAGIGKAVVGEINSVARELYKFGRDQVGADQMGEIIAGTPGLLSHFA